MLVADTSRRARFIKVDVSSWNSQVQLFQQAIEYFPGAELDVLIPCAGIRGYVNLDMPSAPPGLKPLQALQIAASSPPSTACIDVGLIGTTYSVELSIKYGMGLVGAEATQIDKSIILVGSMAGFRFVPGSVDYTAVKWGIRGMFKCMRARLPSLGVRVNLLAPTYIATPLTAKIVPALQSKGVKLGRIVDVVHCVSRIVEDSSIDGKLDHVVCTKSLSLLTSGP